MGNLARDYHIGSLTDLESLLKTMENKGIESYAGVLEELNKMQIEVKEGQEDNKKEGNGDKEINFRIVMDDARHDNYHFETRELTDRELKALNKINSALFKEEGSDYQWLFGKAKLGKKEDQADAGLIKLDIGKDHDGFEFKTKNLEIWNKGVKQKEPTKKKFKQLELTVPLYDDDDAELDEYFVAEIWNLHKKNSKKNAKVSFKKGDKNQVLSRLYIRIVDDDRPTFYLYDEDKNGTRTDAKYLTDN